MRDDHEIMNRPCDKNNEYYLQYEKTPFRRSRRLLVWAMCIPSLCTAADLQTSLNNSLHPVFQAQELTVSVYVNPVLCTVEDASTPPAYHTTRLELVESKSILNGLGVSSISEQICAPAPANNTF